METQNLQKGGMLMLSSMSHQIKRLAAFVALWLGVAMTLWPHPARAQAVRSPEEIRRVVTIEKLSVQDGAVSGEVHNLSSHAVRDVQLFVRHTWLWDNEFRPGKMDPGASTFQTMQKEIPAGGSAPFNFTPSPPLAKAAGGHFVTTVSIAGFTEVIPQSR
jgi:hypothetical protein